MKSDFALAIAQIAAEKDLPKEVILDAVETALASAYRKEELGANQPISVKINPNTFDVKAFAVKTVTDQPTNGQEEISLEEARRLKKDVKVGDSIEVETVLPKSAGRIAAQTAKQVIMQRLHEAENEAIFEEYVGKEGDIVNGIVRRIEGNMVFVDLGRTEAILPSTEQIKGERYRVGQRTKVYLLQIARLGKTTGITVSRAHRSLVWRLFELGVPEIRNGAVELKSIAREAGYRTKIAVAAKQPGIDPVGTCVGQRGIRIQNIVNELEGEKIDVIQWNADPAAFIANALSPAQILSVTLNESEGAATVVVPDRQLSLAIGREGQNARLAAKLTGWRIDIKSASMAEAELKAKQKAMAVGIAAIEEAEAIADTGTGEAPTAPTPERPLVPVAEEAGLEESEPRLIRLEPSPLNGAREEKVEEETPLEPVLPQIFIPSQPEEAPRELRFAEDLVPPRKKPEKKSKKAREEEVAPRGKSKRTKKSEEYEEQEEDEY
jgi:N utilization substance protein A